MSLVPAFILLSASRSETGDIGEFAVGRLSLLATEAPYIDPWTRLTEAAVIGLLDRGERVVVVRDVAGDRCVIDFVGVATLHGRRLLVARDRHGRPTPSLVFLPETAPSRF